MWSSPLILARMKRCGTCKAEPSADSSFRLGNINFVTVGNIMVGCQCQHKTQPWYDIVLVEHSPSVTMASNFFPPMHPGQEGYAGSRRLMMGCVWA